MNREEKEAHVKQLDAIMNPQSGQVARAVAENKPRKEGDPVDRPSQRKRYVLGFMFDANLEQVGLLKKVRPDDQFGLFNGMGGKVEEGETSRDAMVREFKEETGMETEPLRWTEFAKISGADQNTLQAFEIICFATRGILNNLESVTDEEVFVTEIHRVGDAQDCVHTVPWMVRMAADHIRDGQPSYVNVLI